MDNRDEVKAFLTSRCAKLAPPQPRPPGRGRRVPGLRRSEVADLAGVSVEYYAKIERGNLAGVSASVLDALAGALQLDEAERAHLADLARAAGPAPRTGRRPTPQQVRPGVARLLEGMPELPALVHDGRLDVLAANPLARALYSPAFDDPARPVNLARFDFLDPRSRTFWPDWERAADDAVAVMRSAAGRDPDDRALTDLVGELCTRSEQFRTRWAAHDVRLHRTGRKAFHHPVVGDLHLSYEAMGMHADPGLDLIVFSAEPGTPDHDALTLLAGWAATELAAGPAVGPG